MNNPYAPVFELTRGETVESVHFGAISVVNIHGKLVAWYGDPGTVTYLRSSAKPFQVLPFLENFGSSTYNLSPQDIAIMCASHSGMDEHVSVLRAIQAQTGVAESDLLCGVHKPFHKPTVKALNMNNVEITQNRHNCSGKHTGMLAYARMKALALEKANVDLPYIDPQHPVQLEILATFAEMCGLAQEDVAVGVDGCSAPNFAVPLCSAALAFARICDPEMGKVFPVERAMACREVASAMVSHPDMVAGPGRFDTRLMKVTHGRIVAKGGAEAYQGMGLMPGALAPESPAIGIAIKISDGDDRQKVSAAVSLEVLRQLGALSETEVDELSEFGPEFPVHNWRKVVTGQGYPAFSLKRKNG